MPPSSTFHPSLSNGRQTVRTKSLVDKPIHRSQPARDTAFEPHHTAPPRSQLGTQKRPKRRQDLRTPHPRDTFPTILTSGPLSHQERQPCIGTETLCVVRVVCVCACVWEGIYKQHLKNYIPTPSTTQRGKCVKSELREGIKNTNNQDINKVKKKKQQPQPLRQPLKHRYRKDKETIQCPFDAANPPTTILPSQACTYHTYHTIKNTRIQQQHIPNHHILAFLLSLFSPLLSHTHSLDFHHPSPAHSHPTSSFPLLPPPPSLSANPRTRPQPVPPQSR